MSKQVMSMEEALSILNKELDAGSIARECRLCTRDFDPLEKIPKREGDWCLRPALPWSARLALYTLSRDGVLLRTDRPSDTLIKIVHRDTRNRVYFDKGSGYFELTGSILAGERVKLLAQKMGYKHLQLVSQYNCG